MRRREQWEFGERTREEMRKIIMQIRREREGEIERETGGGGGGEYNYLRDEANRGMDI